MKCTIPLHLKSSLTYILRGCLYNFKMILQKLIFSIKIILFGFRVYVIANYTMLHGEQPCEIQTSSSVIYYTTVGPPRPPKLRIVSVDMYQVRKQFISDNLTHNIKIWKVI